MDDNFTRKLIDAYNSHDINRFDELLTEDCVMLRNGAEARGRDAIKRVLGKLFGALPDVVYEIDDVIQTGDKLALRWRGRGTSRGEYLGVAATNRELRSSGITLYQLRDGRLDHIWVSANVIGEPRPARVSPAQPEANA